MEAIEIEVAPVATPRSSPRLPVMPGRSGVKRSAAVASARQPGSAAHREAASVRRAAGASAPGAAVAPGEPLGRPAKKDEPATLQLRAGPDRLAFDRETLARFEREGVISATTVPAPAAHVRGASFTERLASQMRDANARMNVVEGHVQPFLYDFMRAARRDFKPAEGGIYTDPRSPNTVRRALRAWRRQYFIADPRYLAWQRQIAEREASARGGTLDQANVLRKYGQMVDDNAAGNAPIASLVCVQLQPDAPPKVEVSSSSGNRELDRAALASLSHAATSQPLDPDLKPQRACYHFTAAVERAPPIVMAGCSFDEVKLTLGCTYPAMKVLRTNVTLASVE
jgi:hypothetical protein